MFKVSFSKAVRRETQYSIGPYPAIDLKLTLQSRYIMASPIQMVKNPILHFMEKELNATTDDNNGSFVQDKLNNVWNLLGKVY